MDPSRHSLGTMLPLLLGTGGTTASGATVALADTDTAVYAGLVLGVGSLVVTAYELTLRHLDRRDQRRWDFLSRSSAVRPD